MLSRIIQIATDDGDIVLDSFGGSGTTAHAVIELNSETDDDRSFIVVQMKAESAEQIAAETNLCKSLTADRVRRAVKVNEKGSFSYVRVGDPLFGEYRDLGEKLPSFEDLAGYIFYTETSRQIDRHRIDPESGFIGATDAAGGVSYYLFYAPNHKEDRELSTQTLKSLLKRDKNKSWVIYCEKIWLHLDQIRKFELEHGKRIRPMLVPFQLK